MMLKKKITNLVSASMLIFILLFTSTVYVYADTPLIGGKWPTGLIDYSNDGTNSYYQNVWSTAASNWNNSTHVALGTSSSTAFHCSNTYNSGVGWDGITYYSIDSSGYFTAVNAYVNTYYTGQDRYTDYIVNGISTHEMGHSIGLGHNSSTSSVMYPYTFYSDGSLARTYNTPQSPDINTINSIYGPIIAGSSTSSSLGEANMVIKEKGNPKYDKFIVADPTWAIKYVTTNDMAKAADLVVEGQVIKEHGTKFATKGDYKNYHLDSDLKIDKVLKGDSAITNNQITVSQLGGQDDEVQILSKDVTPLKKNNKVILFLKKGPANSYYLINEDESIFLKDETSGNYKNLNSDISKENLLKKISVK